ncbi:MAG: peptide deformylase [Oscillospiraceae bacterium]|nr:peptide deformylase [Oscillospiraceae bacterium]
MALREILTEKKDERQLRKTAREVTVFDERLFSLLEDMKETMIHYMGAGIAATQIGVMKRVVVIDLDDGEGVIELINPVITKEKGKQREVEGCLSLPGSWGYVVRPEYITLRYQTRIGEEVEINAEGLFAQSICHEVDHLNGVLFIDLVDEMIDEEEAGRSMEKRRYNHTKKKQKRAV